MKAQTDGRAVHKHVLHFLRACLARLLRLFRAPNPQPAPRQRLMVDNLETREFLSLATVQIDDVAIIEGDSGTREAVFTVSLSGLSTVPVSVHYFTRDGTARAGEDYLPVSGSLIFPVGRRSQTIAVPIISDTLAEDAETFTVNLTSPINITIRKPTGTCTITDDDRPVVSITARDARAAELNADPAIFRISRTEPSAGALRVYYTVGGTAQNGVDYAQLPSSVLLKARQKFIDVVVRPVNDSTSEDTETVTLTLRSDSRYLLGQPRSAAISILNRETTPPIARLIAPSLLAPPSPYYQFQVKYIDLESRIDLVSLGNGDVRVSGPNGYQANAVLVGVNVSKTGKAAVGIYRLAPPGGQWDPADNGLYSVSVLPEQVRDEAGNYVVAGGIGSFEVNLS